MRPFYTTGMIADIHIILFADLLFEMSSTHFWSVFVCVFIVHLDSHIVSPGDCVTTPCGEFQHARFHFMDLRFNFVSLTFQKKSNNPIMAWFKRTDKGIKTSTAEKKDAPDGLWFKTPKGNIIHTRELKKQLVCLPR